MEVKKYEKIILDSSRSIDDIVASVKAELSKQESKNAGESYICYVSHAYSSGDNAGANYIVVSDGFKELKRLSSNVIQISAYNKDEINELIATNINTKANANAVVNLTDNQTIEGVKTFSSVPVVATQPTNDNQVANKAYVDSKSSQLNSRIDGVNNSLTNSINAKANSNAVVALSGNQTINGVKTFTSNITAPNITTLQNQMNGLSGLSNLISGGKSPYLLHNGVVRITVGDGGNFRNFTDALNYLKQNGSKQYIEIILTSDFNENITLSDLPPCSINSNYRKLGNNLHIKNSPSIFFNSRDFSYSGTLTIENSNVSFTSYCSLRNKIIATNKSKVSFGAYTNVNNNNILFLEAYDSSIFVDSYSVFKSDNTPCIIADDNSTIWLSSYVTLNPANNHAGIVSKFGSLVICKGGFYRQNRGRYFAWVDNGGRIIGNLFGSNIVVNTARTNVAPNTWSPNGMILGSHWG